MSFLASVSSPYRIAQKKKKFVNYQTPRRDRAPYYVGIRKFSNSFINIFFSEFYLMKDKKALHDKTSSKNLDYHD